jgi:hypothetical protein
VRFCLKKKKELSKKLMELHQGEVKQSLCSWEVIRGGKKNILNCKVYIYIYIYIYENKRPRWWSGFPGEVVSELKSEQRVGVTQRRATGEEK